MEKPLEGKKALITGGTTGIGRATAVLLAQNGADVFIFGRHERELHDALSDIKKLSGRDASGTIADVAKYEDLIRVFGKIDEQFSQLDILVNNAGIGARSIWDIDYADLKYVIDVDLVGYLVCAKMALERMVEKGHGHIVNIGSMSAETRDAGTDLYVAAKAGVAGFSDSLRKMINPDCIRLTLIEPGSVGTDLIDESVEEQKKEEEREIMLRAEDVAHAVLFALSQPERIEILKIQLRAHRQII